MNRIRKRPNENGNQDKDLFELISLSSLNTKPVKPLFNRNAFKQVQIMISEFCLGQNLFACPTFGWKRTKIDVNRQKRPRFGQ